jgi:hypothetical protein
MDIEHMIGFASCSVKQLPDIVLLHVGTNIAFYRDEHVTSALSDFHFAQLVKSTTQTKAARQTN